jgi:hypothetical protein
LPYLYPEKTFQPTISKPGELQAEGAIFKASSLSGYSLNGGYALSKNSIVFGSVDLANKKQRIPNVLLNVSGTDTLAVLDEREMDLKYNFNHISLGYGYYYPISDNIVLGATVATGLGKIKYRLIDPNSNAQIGMQQLNSMQFNFGPYVTFSSKTASVSLSSNIYGNSFGNIIRDDAVVYGTAKNYETDMQQIKKGATYLFFKPSLQFSIGAEEYRLYVSYTLIKPFQSIPFSYLDNSVNMGFQFNFNTKNRYGKHR